MNYLLDVITANLADISIQDAVRYLGLPETLKLGTALLFALTLSACLLLITVLLYLQLPRLARSLIERLFSSEAKEIYQTVVTPHQGQLSLVVILFACDLSILLFSTPGWLKLIEIPLGLLVAANICFLSFNMVEELFDHYLLEAALEDTTNKINSELLDLAKFLSNAVTVLIVVFLFAQTHRINLIGLIASLGVTGVALAFASQKIIEQLLWSIVLFVDRRFAVDDYIHLSDSTLGRVESMGWLSTKIRLSGKNTLVVVPNGYLAQINIENLTRARRVISVVDLTLFKAMPPEEKALIHQVILDCTKNIIGIDHRLTQITFQDSTETTGQSIVQVQVIFFILGAAENSMELRQDLLEIARENIIARMQDYGIAFGFKEKTIDIAQPMNI